MHIHTHVVPLAADTLLSFQSGMPKPVLPLCRARHMLPCTTFDVEDCTTRRPQSHPHRTPSPVKSHAPYEHPPAQAGPAGVQSACQTDLLWPRFDCCFILLLLLGQQIICWYLQLGYPGISHQWLAWQ
eukprot:GHUV01042927.1.p2 GENE.GHUV01042927.1~~GHUV01042927.1.p2  ORF type:complete len:128 (+),score=15.34 GHUV01042927.1:563-946(+)